MVSTQTRPTGTISHTTIAQQLRTILALTNAEIQIAEIRQAQARTDAVRDELAGNAQKGRSRAQDIEKALRERGGVVDVVRPVIGRATAAAKSVIEQAQPLDEALLGDLALEQQLVGRAMYLKALATGRQDSELVALADKLIDAHTETVQWITTVLAEEALGGPAALRRTPTQWVSGMATRAVTLPATLAARGLDRAADALRNAPSVVGGLRDRVGQTVDEVSETANRAGDTVVNAGETAARSVAAGRDAALEAVEGSARAQGAPGVADSIHQVREATGIVESGELPIEGYADLNVGEAVSAVKELTEPTEIRVVLAYEEAHKNRQRVVSAAEDRLAEIAKDVVGVQ
ncbi:ferritin-like domain-containing protein [Gordonia sp. HNM0687]|uniref:Ferritin-like domain-containing protein n=1 Tax=Gordonia mangrovi TaxID=2665643 RepID=A0A6L7GIT9_9ACTN|nr:ferritin-like domain-containing protein [Gordonia mangrovi]MXP19756.1 ferritin-like domain-containing protein [Gordonia mangrovi]UVF80633.1 ferritin-like domain-containing protein [Gordonia mangrovi]